MLNSLEACRVSRTDRLSPNGWCQEWARIVCWACLKNLLVHHSGSDCLGSSSHCPTKWAVAIPFEMTIFVHQASQPCWLAVLQYHWHLCPESMDAFVAAVLFKHLESRPQTEPNSKTSKKTVPSPATRDTMQLFSHTQLFVVTPKVQSSI